MGRFRYSYFPKGWPRGVPPPRGTGGVSNSNKVTKSKTAKKRAPQAGGNGHPGEGNDDYNPSREDPVASRVSAAPANPLDRALNWVVATAAADPDDPMDDEIDEAAKEEQPAMINEVVDDGSDDEDSSEKDDAVPKQRIVTQSEYKPSLACRCHGTRMSRARCAGCDCVLAGRVCTAACRCGNKDKLGHTGGCGNPFDGDVRDAFFGRVADELPDEAWARTAKPVLYSHCFAEWLVRKNLLGCLTHSHVVPILLGGSGLPKEPAGGSVMLGKEMQAWLASWEAANDSRGSKGDGTELLRLTRELMRGALGLERDFFGWYYSFCKGEWVAAMWHCHRCKSCVLWNSWHCGRCRKCVAGLLLPCDGCGGVSDDYGRSAEESKARYLAYRYEGVPL